MRLLAATDTGHSPRTDPDDLEPLAGELLLPAEQCDRPHCFCRREFVGVTSHARTTHARVIELNITDEQIRDIARDYVVWLYDEDDQDEIDAYIHDLTDPAADLAAGTVVERWGSELRDIRDNNLPDDAEHDG